jgi:DUF1365 family protein
MKGLPQRPWIGVGRVFHRRLRPVDHAFTYRVAFLMLPLRTLARTPEPALRRNRRGLMSFHDADHGDGGPDALAWIETLLAREGVSDAHGEVWLQCFPRLLGHTFKPVSFWYCERADGSLAAVVAEVHNTFGQRHAYLLREPALDGSESCTRKALHVSPFCPAEGQYRFRFRFVPLLRLAVHIDFDDDEQGAVLQTHLGGTLQLLDAAAVRRVLRTLPWMTLAVVARIHWQALRLWLKRVPWFAQPPAASPASPRPLPSRRRP